MPASPISICGRVVRQLVNEGSKSERNAVLLETEGGSYVLRRRGEAAYGDAGLDELVGASIQAEGTAIGSTLLMDRWRFLP